MGHARHTKQYIKGIIQKYTTRQYPILFAFLKLPNRAISICNRLFHFLEKTIQDPPPLSFVSFPLLLLSPLSLYPPVPLFPSSLLCFITSSFSLSHSHFTSSFSFPLIPTSSSSSSSRLPISSLAIIISSSPFPPSLSVLLSLSRHLLPSFLFSFLPSYVSRWRSLRRNQVNRSEVIESR